MIFLSSKLVLTLSDLSDIVGDLIGILLTHKVAKSIHTKHGRPLDRELAFTYDRFRGKSLETKLFLPLAQLVARKAADNEVWKAALDLTTILRQTTPEHSLQRAHGSTPRSYHSGSHQGSEQTRTGLLPAVKHELHDCTYKDVDGFWEKYFEGRPWVPKSEQIYKRIRDDGGLESFPALPTQDAVWQWWSTTQERYLLGSRGVYYTTLSQKELTGNDSERQLDILMKHSDVRLPPSGKHHWSDVRVVGEHKVSNREQSAKFWQLAIYVRDVFATQPMRRFVHGFLLLGTSMELYIFDRSGAYGASPFDIGTSPERFIRIMSGYALMSDEELGLDTFVDREGEKPFVTVVEDGARKRRRLQLEATPIATQSVIASRGTCCYRTIDGQHVVKFSWLSDRRIPEVEHLRKVAAHDVQGVVRLYGAETVLSVADLRKGLTFSKKRKFAAPHASQSSVSRSQASFDRSVQQGLSLQESGRKRGSDAHRGRRAKASRSNNAASKLSQEKLARQNSPSEPEIAGRQGTPEELGTQDTQEEPGTRGTQEKLGTQGMQEQPGAQDTQEQPSIQNTRRTQTSQIQAACPSQQENFHNRILSCLAVTPAGRPLSLFRTVPELLRALRDAIRAHRSLFLDGKILHRDISMNNVIITDPHETDGFSGMLIDLDLATNVDDEGKNERSGAQRMTGTLKYMAIEVVELGFCGNRHEVEEHDDFRKLDHTYRHDLESFFYVFLDICINHGRERSDRDPLKAWYVGPYEDLVRAKRGDLEEGGFEKLVLPKFHQTISGIKSLAKNLRRVLFLEGKLYTGTPRDSSSLYDQMIQAFDNTIQELC